MIFDKGGEKFEFNAFVLKKIDKGGEKFKFNVFVSHALKVKIFKDLLSCLIYTLYTMLFIIKLKISLSKSKRGRLLTLAIINLDFDLNKLNFEHLICLF